MAPVVIDLTSSPEPDESPARAAKLHLQNFKPRSQKAKNGPEPRPLPPDNAYRARNGTTAPSHPHGLPLPQALSERAGVTDATARKITPTPFPLAQPLSAASNSTRSSSSALNLASNSLHSKPKALPLSALMSRGTSSATPVKSTEVPATRVDKAAPEVIAIDDDSDNASLSDSSDSGINAILQAELDGIRPFKRRKVEESIKTSTSANKSKINRGPTSVSISQASKADNKAGTNSAATPRGQSVVAVRSSATDRETARPRSPEQFSGPRLEGAGTSRSSQRLDVAAEGIPRATIKGTDPDDGLQGAHLRSFGGDLNAPQDYHSGTTSMAPASPEHTRDPAAVKKIHFPDTNHESDRSLSRNSIANLTQSQSRRLPYSSSEDEVLLRLRDIEKLDWRDILPYMPGRTIGSISGHYSELKAKSRKGTKGAFSRAPATAVSVPQATAPQEHIPKAVVTPLSKPAPYSPEEDQLLVKLRGTDNLEWNDILSYFPDRTMGSISGHYGQIKARPEKEGQTSPVGMHSTVHGNNHGVPYSAEEDALLKKLKEVDGLSWEDIIPHFSGRTRGSLQVRYSSKLKSASKIGHPSPKLQQLAAHNKINATQRGPYSADEDALILKLRNEGLNWDQMIPHFSGRTAGALAVRYSSKLKDRATSLSSLYAGDVCQDSTDDDSAARPKRQRRHNGPSVMSGFVSWADIKKSNRDIFDDEAEEVDEKRSTIEQAPGRLQRSGSKSLARILRQREVGSNFGRGLAPSTRSIPDELKHHALDDIGPRNFFQGISGDVTCLAWANTGNQFAAGSIALTDERSMQYNKPCNLLLGDLEGNTLHELPEHHIERPVNADTKNVNSLRSMRETQDRRLFMTVASVEFSPTGDTLYSAGTDRKVRAYAIQDDSLRPVCRYEMEHPEPVYLLSVSNHDILATACHQATDGSIRIYHGQTQLASYSPSRTDSQTNRPAFPSALKWGTSSHHSNLLLAGFSIDSFDEERNLAGETCLWDIRHGTRVEISRVTRNVFDVAWNPSPSSGSTAFAVASTPGVNKVTRGTRSVVQCFAPRQNRAAPVLEFESRAFDINDVVYCPHDNSLIAAGATDGKVYVWDQRYYNKGSGPLHVLSHGGSLNVLDHDRDRELADTGIRFLAWGATSSRLYSGSSDGVVKVWNPYHSSSDAHIKDVVTFTSAVMSGAFSPDYRELLIGEDQGRINLLSTGHVGRSVRSMDRFELHSATPARDSLMITSSSGRDIARELVATRQIELRPMGALPIRQAVQGPNYAGPTLAPSPAEFQHAEHECQAALNSQTEVHLNAAANSTQTSESSRTLQDADERVETAQKTWLQLQKNFDDAEALRPDAEKLQRGFRKEEKERMKLEASMSYEFQQCKLDCNYLPAGMDEGDEVPDSQRSEGRIPLSLWSRTEPDTSIMNVHELVDSGVTERCSACLRPATKPKSGLALCSTCAQERTGLTATCEICSAPIRPVLEKYGVNLCERCNFSCFRCGSPAFVASKATKIACYSCELTWSVGALGYELIVHQNN